MLDAITLATTPIVSSIPSEAKDYIVLVSFMAGSLPSLISSPLAICVSFFSILGTLTIGISVLPQTMETMRNRQTQTFPILMYWFLFVGCFCLGIYGIGLVQAGWVSQTFYYSNANQAYIYYLIMNYLSLHGLHTLDGGNTLSSVVNYLSSTGPGTFTYDNTTYLSVSPAGYAQYAVGDSTPGGMLIIGEFFASITSAIVLWIKYDNQMKAKRAGLTEAQYCEKWLAEKKLAKKGAQQ